jgi:hypothetical protein
VRPARAPLSRAGPALPAVPRVAFGRAHGIFLSSLMRRLDAPIPSRWTSILLRRALMSRLDAPPAIDPVNWVAERAWLLVRMGEADAARLLVQGVDTPQYTPRMIQVAVQTALATADVAALCPLVAPGRRASDEPVWPMADAMCAALEGEGARAGALIDQARRRSGARGIDLALAEKVVGAGTDTRRAVSIQWDEVSEINAWRFGLASATGHVIPDRLMDPAPNRVHAWLARAPMVPIDQRMAAAEIAASLGGFSSAALVDMHGLLREATEPAVRSGTIGERLRTAFTAARPGERMAAIRGLWDEGATPHQRHARAILTASAAARLSPTRDLAEDADELIASMLTAGMDSQAVRWAEVLGGGESGERAWALLAVGAPRPLADISASRVEAVAERSGADARRRAQLLLAGLAGLGRLDDGAVNRLAERLDVTLGRENSWTRMIDDAARRRQPGTVALLAGIGMQTGDWSGISPDHLFRIVRALRIVGHEYEARMIAAEALYRL